MARQKNWLLRFYERRILYSVESFPNYSGFSVSQSVLYCFQLQHPESVNCTWH